MPQFHRFKLESRRMIPELPKKDVEFKVKPKGWFRYIFRCWPYWVGNRVQFRVEVEGKHIDSRILGTLAIYEDLPRPTHWKPLDEPFKLLSNPYAAGMNRGGELMKHLDIVGSRINIPGDGRYMVGYPGEPESFEIITFSAKSDETLTIWLLSIFISLASASVGFILGIFVA